MRIERTKFKVQFMLETPEACTLSVLASLDLEGQQIELPRCFADFRQRRLCFSSAPARG